MQARLFIYGIVFLFLASFAAADFGNPADSKYVGDYLVIDDADIHSNLTMSSYSYWNLDIAIGMSYNNTSIAPYQYKYIDIIKAGGNTMYRDFSPTYNITMSLNWFRNTTKSVGNMYVDLQDGTSTNVCRIRFTDVIEYGGAAVDYPSQPPDNEWANVTIYRNLTNCYMKVNNDAWVNWAEGTLEPITRVYFVGEGGDGWTLALDNFYIYNGYYSPIKRVNFSNYLYVPTILEQTPQYIHTLINLTNYSYSPSSISGFINYNGSMFSATSQIIQTSNNTQINFSALINGSDITGTTFKQYSFFLNYTVNGTAWFVAPSANQTVYNKFIDNCTLANTTTLNFTIRDEITSNIINASIAGLIQFEDGNVTFSNTNSTYLFCINPSWENFNNVYATILYSTNGYATNTYYLINETLNNITQNINLYLLSSENATAINIYLTDTTDNELNGYYAILQRKELSTNTYKTTSISKIDADGLARFNLELYDIFYRWIWKSPSGEIVGQTSDNIVKLTTLYYQLALDENYFTKYEDMIGLSGALTADNASGVITFTYSGSESSIDQYCLRVKKSGSIVDEIISTQCSSAHTGTLTYTVDTTSGSYYAQAYMVASGSTIMMPIDSAYLVYGSVYRTFGKLGLFAVAIWTMSLASVGSMLMGISGIPIFAVIGLMSGVLIKFVSIKWEILISLIILAGVMAWKIRR